MDQAFVLKDELFKTAKNILQVRGTKVSLRATVSLLKLSCAEEISSVTHDDFCASDSY